MISISFKRNSSDEPIGVRCIGHAEYARPGKDIVCAAVSALMQNIVNSMDELTDDDFVLDMNETKGLICLTFKQDPSHDAILLLKSLEIGLTVIAQEYKKNVQIIDWEV